MLDRLILNEKKIDGVLINADSVQVYEDLKLLSARPTEEDMNQIPHFLYGYVKAEKNYSIADWLQQLHKVLDNLKKIIVNVKLENLQNLGILRNWSLLTSLDPLPRQFPHDMTES